jgi:orotidine 5'-phosphate decarboxylase subfamily 2
VDSLLCIGLDPHLELLPHPTAEAARDLCLRLIEATAAHACAFKPNSAFFERFGETGWAVLREVIAAVPPEIPVILDVKRGDIASTAEAYAAAAPRPAGGAVTLNPYLGRDAWSRSEVPGGASSFWDPQPIGG